MCRVHWAVNTKKSSRGGRRVRRAPPTLRRIPRLKFFVLWWRLEFRKLETWFGIKGMGNREYGLGFTISMAAVGGPRGPVTPRNTPHWKGRWGLLSRTLTTISNPSREKVKTISHLRLSRVLLIRRGGRDHCLVLGVYVNVSP